jgi:hypothetical protein
VLLLPDDEHAAQEIDIGVGDRLIVLTATLWDESSALLEAVAIWLI